MNSNAGGPDHEGPDVAQLCEAFSQQFGRPPSWAAAAPGRVNLIGEHIDYNDGFVLPLAIDRRTAIAGAVSDGSGGRIRVVSQELGERVEFQLPTAPVLTRGTTGGWADYVQGVCVGFQQLGRSLPALDLMVDSNVPIGSGLSSSAALEVATATLLEQITGLQLPSRDKALLCQRAEHNFAGVPCGVMDQFASVMGQSDHLMLLDCRSLDVKHVPWDPTAPQILIVNTMVKHALGSSQYPIRRKQCEQAAEALGGRAWRDVTLDELAAVQAQIGDATVARRAAHVVREIHRVLETAEAVNARNWPRVGDLMYASHDSLRDDFEVSCAELDLVVDAAFQLGTDQGVLGARMTGGGFGGCAVILVQPDQLTNVQSQLAEQFRAQAGHCPSMLVTRPANGAIAIGV